MAEDTATASGQLERLADEEPAEFALIRSGAYTELKRRLNDEALAAKIPNGALVRLVTETTKIGAALAKRGREGQSTETVNVLAMLGGLPPQRQVELLVKAIRQLEGAGEDPAVHRSALENLVGEEEAAKALAIELDAGT